MDGETLRHALSRAAGLSRRRAFAAIRAGRVSEDGVARVDPSRPYGGGVIALDGAVLATAPVAHVYLLLNKPAGYLSAASDGRARPTVLDLVPAALRVAGLHPVGRLDLDTTGLLVLTNDGDLTFRLTHPKHEVEKEYWAGVRPEADNEALAALRAGVEIDGARRRPAAVRRLADAPGFQLSITLREGRKRQVRRMLQAVGLSVWRLRRVREGRLRLAGLAEGEVRVLDAPELALLEA